MSVNNISKIEKEKMKDVLVIYDFFKDKKALGLILLDMSKVHSDFDYFLILSANSLVHLNALVKEFYKVFPNYSEFPSIKNKKSSLRELSSGWVVLDLIDLIVHIFIEEKRDYYKLERLWSDAPVLRSE